MDNLMIVSGLVKVEACWIMWRAGSKDSGEVWEVVEEEMTS